MAPIARRPQAQKAIGKKVHRKRAVQREPSNNWDLLNRQGMNPNNDDDGDDDNIMDEQQDAQEDEQMLALEGPTDVEQAVTPLREMADRVGKEVESFAQTLDAFLSELPTTPDRFDFVQDLVSEFIKLSQSTVSDLNKSHEREMREQLKKEWSEQAQISTASTPLKPFTSTGTTSLSSKKAEQVKELRQWQQEVDTWDLFRTMLDLHPFEEKAEEIRKENRDTLQKLGDPHRYTSESDLWKRFLIEDEVANERFLIKEWLERTARNEASDVQGIVEELETRAGRGKGLWSAGWMHTREKIKGEKRLRSWPIAADSPLPQIRRSDNNELLVTALDPDAPTRQQRTLEKPDAFLERAMWTACWEMLRRGTSAHEVCEWFGERKEGWRAVLVGKAMDIMDPAASSAAWRHMCLLTSQSSCSEYEAAVYGLLSGNVKAMEKVCHTIDDHLYAYYSAALVRQYDQYVASVCPWKAPPQEWRHILTDNLAGSPADAERAISNLIGRLRKSTATGSEAVLPMKIIQSFLLADQVGSLIHTVGAALAQTATLQGPENMIYLRERDVAQVKEPIAEAAVGLDQQTLRITAHMAIIYRILAPDHLQEDDLLEDENVLVAYIQALRASGKRDLIPLYASQLERTRGIVVLGHVFQDVRDSSEQKTMLSLVEKYELDVKSILIENLDLVVLRTLRDEPVNQPLRILESTAETKIHPGQRIMLNFIPDGISAEDEAVVNALHWYLQLHGQWKFTFEALTLVLRKCLVNGRFGCARAIVNQFRYDKVARKKTYEILGRSVDFFDEAESIPTDEREAAKFNVMKKESRTYIELESLVRAVNKLSAWRSEETKYIDKEPRPSAVPSSLRKAKDYVTEAMEPLLQGILQHPVDEDEAKDLALIQTAYLPEIIIAYNTVLHAAGNVITRDSLLESMDLSVTIAQDNLNKASVAGEKNGLAECFVRAGRMRELMASFALTSKAMLILKAEGKPWRAKRDREGKDLGIWEISGRGGRGELVVEE